MRWAGSSPLGRPRSPSLRAAVIIGSGSISFEVIRHLTEILPIMLRPGWLRTRCQPIAIRDVLAILIAAVTEGRQGGNHIYDIGGPDILTYQEMMQEYATAAGLRKRLVIPAPVLAGTHLSAYFVGMSTPLPKTIVRPLIESLRNDVVVTRPSPPGFEPEKLAGYRVASIGRWRRSHTTRWRPAGPMPSPTPERHFPPTPVGRRQGADRPSDCDVPASTEDVFWAVSRIGGDVGYYALNWTWKFRGWFDRLIGGVGLRRGRRHPEELRPGETLDFFRVVDVDPIRHRLLLQAEMKVPGTAWLGWAVDDTEEGTRLIQSARFIPVA